MSTTAISIRLDSDIKESFDQLCKEFGLSTNAAFNLFARTKKKKKAIPFPISLSKNPGESQDLSTMAQIALERSQQLSSREEHEWTEGEIDQLIADYRKQKRNL